MANAVAEFSMIDTHVHIFTRDLPFAPGRRYAPDNDAPPAALAAAMATAGIARAILVQPSFLGTDNSYLLAAIKAQPARFSGIAVVDPGMSRAGLTTLKAAGVLGVRLNLIGSAGLVPAHISLAENLAHLGMVLQIQAEGAQWPAMHDFLRAPPGPVVIDHFGRTAPGDGSRGFQTLLEVTNDLLWFKFSAPYRLPRGAARDCARAIIEGAGTERLLWGSDWPHTQFEGQQNYAETLAWLDDWVPDPVDRRRVLSENPARLIGFASTIAPV